MARITLTTSPQRISTVQADAAGAPTANASQAHVLVRNTSATAALVDVFTVGTAAGTINTALDSGFSLAEGEAIGVDLDSTEALYGKTASGTAACHYVESGVDA